MGWTRKTGVPEPAQAVAPIGATAIPNTQPAGYYDSYGQPTSRPAIVDQVNGSFTDGRPYADRYVRSIHRPVQVVNQAISRQYVDQNERIDQTYRRDYTDREPVRSTRYGRSTEKSALIVGGSAAGGAAIGAVAAGGKGAALGALSGGAAGFVYDRLTHNHH